MSKKIDNIDNEEFEDIENVEEDSTTEITEKKDKNTTPKYTSNFEKAIKEYLDQLIVDNEIFKEKYNNPNKSIKDCCAYILGEVYQSQKTGLTDDEVFYLARHYYEEENIKINSVNARCNVVTNKVYELNEEEKEKMRLEALEKYKQDEIKRIQEEERKKKEKEERRIEKKLKKEKEEASLSGQMSFLLEDF